MSEREPISFPTNHISREDLASVDPTRKTAIDALTEADMELIAKEIGEAVNDMFWSAASIVLDRHIAPASDHIPLENEQTMRSGEPVSEQDKTPEKLIARKEAIMTAFHALPPEHQASMSIVIVGRVMEGEWGDWMQDAFNRLYPSPEVFNPSEIQFPAVTRDQLHQIAINANDVQTFTDDDLTTIATNMHSHYIHDLFWDELQFHTESFLDAKRNVADSNPDPQSRTTDTTG